MLLQKLGKERDSKHSTYYLFFWTESSHGRQGPCPQRWLHSQVGPNLPTLGLDQQEAEMS